MGVVGDYRISTGTVEGTTNKIKTLQKKLMATEIMNCLNLKFTAYMKLGTFQWDEPKLIKPKEMS